MAVIRQTRAGLLFRTLVVPTMLLCGIFRRPVFQWLSVIALGIWLLTVLADAFARNRKRISRKQAERSLLQLSESTQKMQQDQAVSGNDLFLIRQVNYRITEQIKATYPMVSWLWDKTPTAAELCAGGTWRIRVTNTEPFNFGEVTLTSAGKLTISMLQLQPLDTPITSVVSTEDLKKEDLLDRIDVKTWYLTRGEQVIAQMIDDLNAQGHRQLIIKDNGDVCITAAGIEQAVDLIQDFPPRFAWEEFKQLLLEDDIEATVMPDGLILAW